MNNSALYIACLISGGAGAWVAARFAYKWSMVDIPGVRSSHTQPIPKGGGIGILAAFILSSLMLGIPSGFWLSATVLAWASFYGDRSELSLKFRLAVQFAAALVFLFAVFVFPFLTSSFSSCFRAGINPALIAVLYFTVLTVFIVGTANFYNFMDGINGIAGITGVVGFGLLAFFAFYSGTTSSLATLAICMSLSCLGFLPFNMPIAKVFMGDVGSILLGFVFAGMVILLSKSFLDFVCLTAFLFPFYADELTTMCLRLRNRENLTHPHRKHLYQLLANERKVAHWKISTGYGMFQLVVGISVLLVKPLGIMMVLFLLSFYVAGFVLLRFGFLR